MPLARVAVRVRYPMLAGWSVCRLWCLSLPALLGSWRGPGLLHVAGLPVFYFLGRHAGLGAVSVPAWLPRLKCRVSCVAVLFAEVLAL